LKEFEKLEKQLKKDLESIKTIETKAKNLYKQGIIDEKKFLEIINHLKTVVNQIEKVLSLIKQYKFQKKVNNLIQSLPFPQVVKNYSQKKLKEKENSIKKENFDRIIIKRELLKKLKMEKIEKKYEERKKELELVKLKKRSFPLKLKSFSINFDLGKYSHLNKVFDFFMLKFNFFYIPILEFLDRYNLSRTQKHLLATIYTITMVFFSYLTTIFFSLLVLYYLEVVTNIEVLKKIAKYSFFLGLISIIILVFYPYYYIKQKEKEIEDVLPFALVHMSAITSSGVNFYLALKMIAETKEYKSLSEVFQKIVALVEVANMDIISAIKEVAEDVPSRKLREILNSIVYITKTGGDITQYLNQKAEEAILNLKISKEKYIGFLDVFSDLYVVLIVAIPILFISIVAVLSSFSPSEKLYKIAKLGAYVFIPLFDLAFLLLLNLQQKS
jgi:pilus assembly protein TadC